MNFITSSNTDIGVRKSINQDSLFVHRFTASLCEMVFAVICDGMGGHSDGEVASRIAAKAFADWELNTLPSLLCYSIDDSIIREQWSNIIAELNTFLRSYGEKRGVILGTTVTALLITQARWFCLNIGDTRAYEMTNNVVQLTRDHTFVESEVARGNMTAEQAEKSPKRNVLTQCVGIANKAEPDFFCGSAKQNTLYMLCSDGFRHMITPSEMFTALRSGNIPNDEELHLREKYLIELNKQRGETDNISVITILTV